MRRVYLLPNLLTTFSLACGLFVIFKMTLLAPGAPSYPVLMASTVLLLLAGLADTLDGAAARLIRAESEFGLIFDSLSDGITFGVAPAVLALKSLSLGSETNVSLLVSTAAMLFSICGVLRLVRYSVMGRRVKHQSSSIPTLKERAKRRFFTGLPIPAAACCAVSTTLLLASPQLEAFVSLSYPLRGLILSGVLLLTGYLMVSRMRFPSLKTLHMRLWSYNLIFVMVALAVVLFYGILHYFPFMFALLAWGYVTLSVSLSLLRTFRKSGPEAGEVASDS